MNDSMWLSVGVAVVFAAFQTEFFLSTRKKLNEVKNLFLHKSPADYTVSGYNEKTQIDPSRAPSESTLHTLIEELNAYATKNHGTADFSVIQNKTERKVAMLYDEAVSRIAFPIYIGLMGTFAGVFMGLCFFYFGLNSGDDGITDASISSLIQGVLVSMGTSFLGLFLTICSNYKATEVKKQIDEDKNSFYEFIQNELLPTLGVSMVDALNKLHHTINIFEPAFNGVIDRFQQTFDRCTTNFGDAFEKNVAVVSQAVATMGKNMDKINENVALQGELLKTMKSRGVVTTLQAFVDAAYNVSKLTVSAQRVNGLVEQVSQATQQLITTQNDFNLSLKKPVAVANKLEALLNRFANFEDSIKALGPSIQQTQLFGYQEVQLIQEQLRAIKSKQEIAIRYIDTADGNLQDLFALQGKAIQQLNLAMEEAMAGYGEKFQDVLDNLAKEVTARHNELVHAMEQKFSLPEFDRQLSKLELLETIGTRLDNLAQQTDKTDLTKLQKLDTIANRPVSDPSIVRMLQQTLEAAARLNTLLDNALSQQSRKEGFFGLFGRR